MLFKEIFSIFVKNFNLKTLKQLQNATLAVKNKKDSSALAEMFSIELKFTVDCLKFWFKRNMKRIELDENVKDDFIQRKKHLRKNAAFVIFQLKVEQRMGGLIMSVKQNICFWKIFYQMGISTFDIYFSKIIKILEFFDDFCEDLE